MPIGPPYKRDRSPREAHSMATLSKQTLHRPQHAMGPRVQFEEGLEVLKERQLVFRLARQLADAQIVSADQPRTERLWREVAALDIDANRIIPLLYGGHDLDDTEALEEIDRVWRHQARQKQRRSWRRPAWLGGRQPRTAVKAPSRL